MGSPDLVSELSRWLDTLSRRWERFFAHDPQVRTPPEPERLALERRMRELSRLEAQTAAEGFRLEQLLYRFSTYNAHWQRQLRDREESRKRAAADEEINAGARAAVPPAGDEYQELHAAYTAALEATGAPGAVSLERFRDSLIAQRRSLEGRGAVVEGFDVVPEGGQVKIRARVRRGR